MSQLGLGKLIDTPQQRDAIHVAVAPVVAAQRLNPGCNVGLDANGRATNRTDNAIGVIDPFLKHVVLEGESCWLFLYPETVTGMRHEWQHPAFPEQAAEPSDKAESMRWMEEFASKHHEPYRGNDEEYPGPACTAGQLIEAGREFLQTGDMMVQRGDETLRDIGGHELQEFWKHFAVITGISVPQFTENPFSCTC